jgi:tetratricopeptide (TPR) repeat protein
MTIRRFLSLAGLLALATPSVGAPQLRPPASCEPFRTAVTADPNNLDAAVRLGQCTLRDLSLIAPGGDSTRLAFRSSWTVALRALRHAIEVDPTYARAYRPLFRILLSEMRDGCSYETGYCLHVAPILRDADSIVTPPRLVAEDGSIDPYDDIRREWQERSRANLEEARAIATRWAAVAPNDPQPHAYLGRSLLLLGEHAAAAGELELAASLGTPASRRELFWARTEALVKSNRGADARRVLDEAASDPARDTSNSLAYAIWRLNGLLGRQRPMPVDSAVLRRYRPQIDSMRRNPPPLARPVREPTIQELIASGDSAGARRLLARMDSAEWTRRDARVSPRFSPWHLDLARYHLALGDTAEAEDRLEKIGEPFETGRFQVGVGLMYRDPHTWLGHLWMLRGDVAVARGRADEARAMYRRVIGLWEGADADVQSVVGEARVRLAALDRRR